MRLGFVPRVVAVTLVIVVTALGVAGCGESKEQKAQKAVCSARADIHKSITSLQGLTATTATVDGIKNDVTSIQTSLQTIRDNQDELSSARKAKVTAGAQQFAQQLQTIASGLTSNLSLANASAQVKSAAANLQSAFAAALAPIDCS